MTISPTNERETAATDRANDGSWISSVRRFVSCSLSMATMSSSRLDGLDLRFHAVTDDERRWRTQILLDEQHAVARLYVYLDLEGAALRREWVLELVCRVNSLLAIGAFDFDWETGEVAFRHGRDFTGQTDRFRAGRPTPQSRCRRPPALYSRDGLCLCRRCIARSGRSTAHELLKILPSMGLAQTLAAGRWFDW